MPDSSKPDILLEMTPERWRKIGEVFDAAAAVAPDRRAAFLEGACGSDAELRDQVQRLLENDSLGSGFLSRPPLEGFLQRGAADAIRNDESSAAMGRRIGAYRLIRQIGAGGMGSVWLADRADAEFDKQVAIKVIKRGMDTDEVLRRFRAERQVLARLEHPNIARLHDGGATPDGQPFLVMEHIDGTPLDRYCDEKKLSIQKRLELFRSVCAAVQYAHQNLVVHRDLKPSNILVTAENTVKLLDFGIAKVLAEEGEGPPRSVTMAGQRPMTPEYASPEQVRGGTMTTATDIYSLGVILYELLTGKRPYRSERPSLKEVEQAICEEEPQAPSTRVRADMAATSRREPDVRRLQKRLRGDLDTIVLKALRKEPARRYSSAEQLSEDIRRHLDGLPVIARPDTFSYRTRKFLRRNRIAVALTAGLFLSVAVLAVSMTVQSRRISEQRNRALAAQQTAEREAERAKEESGHASATVGFLQQMLSALDPTGSRDGNVPMREFLDKAAQQVEPRFPDNLIVRASLQGAIGVAYRGLGMYKEARERLEKAVADGRQYLGAKDHAGFTVTLSQLGHCYRMMSDLDSAERIFREALAMRERLFGKESLQAAASIVDIATVLGFKGDASGAEDMLRRVLALYHQLSPDDDAVAAGAMMELGGLLCQKGQYSEGEPLVLRAIAIYRKSLGDDDPAVTQGLLGLADQLVARGDYEQAEKQYREVLAIEQKRFGQDHPYLSNVFYLLGDCLMKQGKLDEAEPYARRSLMFSQKSLGDEDVTTANCKETLGIILARTGRLSEGETLCRQAVATRRRLQGPNHPALAGSLNYLGNLLFFDKEDYEGAESAFREALAIEKKTYPSPTAQEAGLLHSLGEVFSASGEYDAAIQFHRQSLVINTKLWGRPGIAVDLYSIAFNLAKKGECAEAEQMAREALEIEEQAHPGDTVLNATLLSGVAMALKCANRFDEAESIQRKALSMDKKITGDKSGEVAYDLCVLGDILLGKSDLSGAESVLRQSIAIYQERYPDQVPRDSKSNLGECLTRQSRFDEAEPFLLSAYTALHTKCGDRHDDTIKCARRIASLYEAWGKHEKAAEYRSLLAASQPASGPAER